MPIKLSGQSHDDEEARIEIVPLIDIMFFLLAVMMLVSLGSVKLKLLSADIPVAVAGNPAKSEPPMTIAVARDGFLTLDGKPLADAEATATLKRMADANKDLRIVIAADKDARHESVLHALDHVRQAGIDKIAFAAKSSPDGKHNDEGRERRGGSGGPGGRKGPHTH